MRWTIERLRLAIVVLAGLLLLAIAGSFFYGRWRLRHLAQDLPARLGLQIEQSTQGFMLSKTEQGHTLFTLHAARAVEFKSGGRVSLHHVKIDLYNRQTGIPDTIAGDDFEFDRHTQVVEAKGEAQIVLHGMAPGKPGEKKGQTVRVTTHDLIFNQKTGVAVSTGEVDFQMADSSGHAVGAVFNSRLGSLLLKSQVVMTTTVQGQPATLNASHAVYDRGSGQVNLWQPRYRSASQSGSAAAATVLLRGTGNPEQLDAHGDVKLISTNGMQVRSPAMQVWLNERSQPRTAHFSGGVEFADDGPAQQLSGTAGTGDVEFDARGRARQVTLDQSVQATEQARRGASRFQRTLAANHLVLDLSPSKKGNAQLKEAKASGNAVLTSISTVPGHPRQQTAIAGQQLNITFAGKNRPRQLDGSGQTRLKMIAANGDLDSSSGDALHIDFAQGAGHSIRTAVQSGHVVLRQKASAKNSRTENSTATAERASYIAANDTLTLTGAPTWSDGQLRMAAVRMEVERKAGRMIATGAVQTTLLNGSSAAEDHAADKGSLLGGRQPAHIISDQATVRQATQTALFSGRARLWQDGNAIEAPTIELSQKTKTLKAYGPASCTDCVLGSFMAGGANAGSFETKQQASVFRVRSQRLVYSDAERKASFLNHVHVVGDGAVLRAQRADIFLSPGNFDAEAKNTRNRRNHPAPSSVTKMVATGNVRLVEPGRTASGTRLVYAVADGHFVLTGTEEDPPMVAEAGQGTVTGQVLTFAPKEQAIMVSGAPGHVTTTKTRVQKP